MKSFSDCYTQHELFISCHPDKPKQILHEYHSNLEYDGVNHRHTFLL